jgi:putative oxidoreductase
MIRKWFKVSKSNPSLAVDIVRITIAIILGIHGVHGLVNPQAVKGFGQYLGSLGFPLGIALAWFLMVFQVGCSMFMITNRLVAIACIGHILILVVGLFLIHIHDGWFVVGAGRNGIEYSITLIACLSAIMIAYWPRKGFLK